MLLTGTYKRSNDHRLPNTDPIDVKPQEIETSKTQTQLMASGLLVLGGASAWAAPPLRRHSGQGRSARGRLGCAPVRQRGEGFGAPRPQRCGSAGKARARSGEDERGGPGMRMARAPARTREARWPAGEESRVRVGPVTACARDEAKLRWSPGGGGAAGSDRSGGEDEATVWRRQRRRAWRRRAWFIKGDL